MTSTATTVSATFAIDVAAVTGPQSVTVTTAGGASNAVAFTINPPAPTLAGVSPASGVTGASVAVVINGSNLTGATLNTGANITASGVTVSATQITATFTLGAVTGAQSISVTTPSGTSNALSFTIVPPAPTLASIAPSSGVQGTSFGVTLSGSNLTGATVNPVVGVTISGVSSTATSVSATFAIAANAATGTPSVTVTTAGGASNAVTFTINPAAPTLTGIAPASGAQGATVSVTISGTNLSGATVNPVAGVTISGVTSTATSVSATFAIAAAATVGGQSVTVTTPGGTSNAVTFTITSAAPTISSITPSTILRNTSTTMSIVGSRFAAGATVKTTPAAGITFGTVTVVDSSHISVPITVANKAATGNHSVTVTVGGLVSNAVTLTIQ